MEPWEEKKTNTDSKIVSHKFYVIAWVFRTIYCRQNSRTSYKFLGNGICLASLITVRPACLNSFKKVSRDRVTDESTSSNSSSDFAKFSLTKMTPFEVVRSAAFRRPKETNRSSSRRCESTHWIQIQSYDSGSGWKFCRRNGMTFPTFFMTFSPIYSGAAARKCSSAYKRHSKAVNNVNQSIVQLDNQSIELSFNPTSIASNQSINRAKEYMPMRASNWKILLPPINRLSQSVCWGNAWRCARFPLPHRRRVRLPWHSPFFAPAQKTEWKNWYRCGRRAIIPRACRPRPPTDRPSTPTACHNNSDHPSWKSYTKSDLNNTWKLGIGENKSEALVYRLFHRKPLRFFCTFWWFPYETTPAEIQVFPVSLIE